MLAPALSNILLHPAFTLTLRLHSPRELSFAVRLITTMQNIVKNSMPLTIIACCGAAAATGWSLYALLSLTWTQLAFFAVLLFLLGVTRHVIARRSESLRWSCRALTDAVIFLTAMSLGAWAATLLAVVDGLFHPRRAVDLRRAVLSVSTSVIAVATSATLYEQVVKLLHAVVPQAWLTGTVEAGAAHLGLLVAPLCLMVASQIFIKLIFSQLCDGELDEAMPSTFGDGEREHAIRSALTRTAALTQWAGAAAAILVFATLQGASVVFLFVGAFIILLVHLLYRFNEQRVTEIERREREKVRHIEEMATLHINTIESLAIAIDAKDQMTHGHVRRTQIYAMQLGKYLGMSGREMQALEAGALLHDVGKLAVPEYILNKPGKLTAAEFEKMKIHTTVGGDIIRRVGFPYPVEDIVRYHHERWDGTGYPRGLRAERIPIVARIIAVVDFYDATRCDRPYRKGMKREDSLNLIRSMAGSSFDPRVVDSFIEHIDELDKLIADHDISEQVASDLTEMADTKPDAGLAAETLGDPNADAGYDTIVAAQREVFALHEIAQTIGSSLNLQDTVTLITGKLGAIVPFDTCIIYLTDEQTGKAHAVHVAGANADAYARRRITIGEGVSGWVIANGRSMCNTPPELDLVGVKEDAARKVRALLSSPLIGDGAAFGALTLLAEHRGSYTSEHVRLLESVAQYAAIALNNALTYERTKESALNDVLTGMPNARALRFMLAQRIAESERLQGEQLAVLAINLTDFKTINEKFGRQVGDRILTDAANLIKAQFRTMDIVARYTGDEFVAVMPMASLDVAQLVADRIQTAFDTHSFIVRHAETEALGISIGIACYPEQGANAEDLLAAAERQLHHNKHIKRIEPNLNSPNAHIPFELAR